jgi:hypothetical protein
VFSEKEALTLPPHRDTDHSIEIEPDAKPLHGRIYNPPKAELKALKAYIETNLANGFIQRSCSPAAAPIAFAAKKDAKNHCPLPLILETRDRMRNARIFTKLDLRGAHKFDLIRTRYRQYKYRVMPFGLINAPTTLQAYMD